MLTATWLLPALGGLAVWLLPVREYAKWLSVAVAAATLLVAAAVALGFDTHAHGYQYQETLNWIGGGEDSLYRIRYHLGVDGISLWLVVLNALIGLLAVAATSSKLARDSRFLALLLFMQAGMAGVFVALDLVLFYFFWEAMLIPAYFLLWQWGEGARPARAAIKFVLYTLVGSLLMLVGIIGEYALTGAATFDLPQLVAYTGSHPPVASLQFGLFALFAIGFLVKIPVFPFHSWLPDAYLAAPTPMLLALAGVMGKTGAYGLLRVVIPLFPNPSYWWNWNWVIPILAVAGIVWGALLALAQSDLKALIAYSSLSHMGFIVLGIFSFNAQGQQGAVIQMINHGVIIPALFLLVGWLALRAGSRDRSRLAALAPRMPVLAGVFLVVTLAALGLPGLNSFVGEFMTVLGAWQFSPALAVAACIGLILAPIYMLRLFQGAMHGAPSPLATPAQGGRSGATIDLGRGELGLLAPLVLLMFVLGLYPYVLTSVMSAIGQPMPW